MAKFKFRQHRGTLAESMKTVVELGSHQELIDHIKLIFEENQIVFEQDKLKIEPYCGIDKRINWASVSIVSIEGYGIVGFMNTNL